MDRGAWRATISGVSESDRTEQLHTEVMLPSPFLFGRAVSVIGFLRRMIQKIHSRRVEKSLHVCAKSLQLCLTLSDPVDCSPPGSSVHGILQARILEWVAMPAFRASSQPRDQTRVSYVSCISRQILYH